MRYKKLTVKHCDISTWGIFNKCLGLVIINNSNRQKIKLKLARKQASHDKH